jgi:hypothetical protein
MDLHKNASQLGQVDLFHGEDHTMTNYIKNYIKNHSKIAAAPHPKRLTQRPRRSPRFLKVPAISLVPFVPFG